MTRGVPFFRHVVGAVQQVSRPWNVTPDSILIVLYGLYLLVLFYLSFELCLLMVSLFLVLLRRVSIAKPFIGDEEIEA
ncbi:MAG: hypothetical protein QXR62_06565, partial [Candidatus Bathyarchaeia archaeon]